MLSLTIVVLLTSDLSILDVKDDAMVCLCTASSFTPSYGTLLRMGGRPVFRGTRVPLRFMFESLKLGESVEGFVSDYTSVEREDALRILEVASELVEIATYENVVPR